MGSWRLTFQPTIDVFQAHHVTHVAVRFCKAYSSSPELYRVDSVALISSTVRNRHMVVMAAHQKELVSEQELELRPTRLEIKNPQRRAPQIIRH